MKNLSVPIEEQKGLIGGVLKSLSALNIKTQTLEDGNKDAMVLIGETKRGLKDVEAELKMLSALTSGGAIDDHLEPAYFAAMTRAVEAASAEA